MPSPSDLTSCLASVAAGELEEVRCRRGAHQAQRMNQESALLIDHRPGAGYPHVMHYRDIITIEPGKRGGKPCIRGLRITVYDVLEYLASGMSMEEILSDFPDLTKNDIHACLAFAADRERKFVTIPPT